MSLPAPSTAVCSLMDGQTLNPPSPGIPLSLGVNLFRGYVRAPVSASIGEVPAIAVFVLCLGGTKPVHYMSSPSQRTDRLYASVRVFVRMEPNRFGDGEDMARSVWRLLQRNIPNGYLECKCEMSEPEFLGPDDTEHPVWTINLRLEREE